MISNYSTKRVVHAAPSQRGARPGRWKMLSTCDHVYEITGDIYFYGLIFVAVMTSGINDTNNWIGKQANLNPMPALLSQPLLKWKSYFFQSL